MTVQSESGCNFTLITNPSQAKRLYHERLKPSLPNTAVSAEPFHYVEGFLYPFLLFLAMVIYIHAIWNHLDSFVLSNPGFATAEQVFPIQLDNREFWSTFFLLSDKRMTVFLTWWGSTEQAHFIKLPVYTISAKINCQNCSSIIEPCLLELLE